MDRIQEQLKLLGVEDQRLEAEIQHKSDRVDQLAIEIRELSKATDDHSISAKADSEKRLSHLRHRFPSDWCIFFKLVTGLICFCAGLIAYDRGRRRVGTSLVMIGIGLFVWGCPRKRIRATEQHDRCTIKDQTYIIQERQTSLSQQDELKELLISIDELYDQRLYVQQETIRLGNLLLNGSGGEGGGTDKPTLKQVQLRTPSPWGSSEGS